MFCAFSDEVTKLDKSDRRKYAEHARSFHAEIYSLTELTS